MAIGNFLLNHNVTPLSASIKCSITILGIHPCQEEIYGLKTAQAHCLLLHIFAYCLVFVLCVEINPVFTPHPSMIAQLSGKYSQSLNELKELPADALNCR